MRRDTGGRTPGAFGAIRAGAALVLLLALTACAVQTDPSVTVRHFPSTAFHEGTRLHVFVFDPRPLAERIRLARNQIEAEPGCRWKAVPTGVIEEATQRQGERWAGTLLAAPVECAT